MQNVRLDKHDAKLDKHDAKLDNVDAKLDKLALELAKISLNGRWLVALLVFTILKSTEVGKIVSAKLLQQLSS